MGRNFWVDAGEGFAPGQWTTGAIAPRVDIVEDDSGVTIFIELPGVYEDDIQLALHSGVLTVSGEKYPHTKEEKQQSYYLAERAFGTFRRSINLPAGLDEDAAEAEFAAGVLTVRLPRRTEPGGGRQIPITSR